MLPWWTCHGTQSNVLVTAHTKPRHIQVTHTPQPGYLCPQNHLVFALPDLTPQVAVVWQTLADWCCDNYWRIGQNHVAFVLRGLPRQVAVVWQTLAHWCCDKYWQILDARAESRHGATAHPGYLQGQMAHIQVTFALRTTWFLPCQICHGWCCVANTDQLVLR